MYNEEERTKWRDGFKHWKETGESPWKAGKRLSKYKDGQNPRVIPERYDPFEDVYDAGTLLETIITPDKELRKSLVLALGGNELFYKGLVNDVWKYKLAAEEGHLATYSRALGNIEPSSNELRPANYEIQRLADIAKSAGSPRVWLANTKNDEFYNKENDRYRAHTYSSFYQPDLYLGDPEYYSGYKSDWLPYLNQYLAELSHSVLFRGGNFNWRVKNIRRRGSEGNNDNPTDVGYGQYDNGYNDPGNTEYLAHNIIQHAIDDYMRLGESFGVDKFYKSIYKDVKNAERHTDPSYKGSGVAEESDYYGKPITRTIEPIWKSIQYGFLNFIRNNIKKPTIYKSSTIVDKKINRE